MAQNHEIQDADKLLFAEDFMMFMMLLENRGSYKRRHEDYRPLWNNAFNESVQKAVRKLHAGKEGFPPSRTVHQGIDEYTIDLYMEFTEEMTNFYFYDGFRISNFLTFCVRVTSMATLFYAREVTQAPALAVQCIYDNFRGFDMTTGGWDILQSTAEIVVK